jgi:hypothetical protein
MVTLRDGRETASSPQIGETPSAQLRFARKRNHDDDSTPAKTRKRTRSSVSGSGKKRTVEEEYQDIIDTSEVVAALEVDAVAENEEGEPAPENPKDGNSDIGSWRKNTPKRRHKSPMVVPTPTSRSTRRTRAAPMSTVEEDENDAPETPLKGKKTKTSIPETPASELQTESDSPKNVIGDEDESQFMIEAIQSDPASSSSIDDAVMAEASIVPSPPPETPDGVSNIGGREDKTLPDRTLKAEETSDLPQADLSIEVEAEDEHAEEESDDEAPEAISTASAFKQARAAEIQAGEAIQKYICNWLQNIRSLTTM